MRATPCFQRLKGFFAQLAPAQNHEFGAVVEGKSEIATCRLYFNRLWNLGKSNLTSKRVEEWEKVLDKYQGRRPNWPAGLKDFGEDIGIPDLEPAAPPTVPVVGQAFVKFAGTASNRAPLSRSTLDEIKSSHCSRVCSYPAGKRPRSVRDGARMFIGRLTEGPQDIRVFGRAIGMQHVPELDDASPDDIKLRPWNKEWPHYIRVHDGEFVDGTLVNGVSLSQLMDVLGANAFASTQRNGLAGEGNTDPRKAYLQQAAVKLSDEGCNWLDERLNAALSLHGKVSEKELRAID